MVPYYGRHGAKQFIRGKPIRFGFKMWVLTTPLGYIVQCEPYQGATGRPTAYPGVGIGGEVVLDLIAELQEVEGCSFHLTFDNLFTSLKLVDRLSEKNIACTGTIRANRLKDCPLRDVKDMQKTPRGTFDYATDTKSGLIVVRWNDNNIVNVVSNKVGVHPLQVAKRWSRSESRQVQLPQPFLIRHYNQTMGGVDRTDQNVGKYSVAIRSKKWWWAIFGYCLDVCIQQVWHLYRATEAAKNNPLDLLAIRRRVVRVYLGCASHHAAPGRPRGHVSVDKRVLEEIRFDRLDHLVELWPTQLGCGACGKKTKHRCSKCKVGVHDRCFRQYHTK
ncbi:piggyBac transposable element-derived protein 3-like [Littorina saxatilis]|uniref:piggyBac transposable element-derived protein 3-like n=1 Tax=Littorina saxatilis TaxID=31220 RepID=UPI0038B48BC0